MSPPWPLTGEVFILAPNGTSYFGARTNLDALAKQHCAHWDTAFTHAKKVRNALGGAKGTPGLENAAFDAIETRLRGTGMVDK